MVGQFSKLLICLFLLCLICVYDIIGTIYLMSVVGFLVVLNLRTMVARRNDDAIVEALVMLAGVIGQQPHVNSGNKEEDEFHSLGKF